jgi:hypothetical protein
MILPKRFVNPDPVQGCPLPCLARRLTIVWRVGAEGAWLTLISRRHRIHHAPGVGHGSSSLMTQRLFWTLVLLPSDSRLRGAAYAACPRMCDEPQTAIGDSGHGPPGRWIDRAPVRREDDWPVSSARRRMELLWRLVRAGSQRCFSRCRVLLLLRSSVSRWPRRLSSGTRESPR